MSRLRERMKFHLLKLAAQLHDVSVDLLAKTKIFAWRLVSKFSYMECIPKYSKRELFPLNKYASVT